MAVYYAESRYVPIFGNGCSILTDLTSIGSELLSSANAKMYNVIVTGVYNSLPVQPPTLGRILLRFFRLGTNRVESMSMSFDFIGTRREVRDRAAVLANCPITREVLGNVRRELSSCSNGC